MLIHFTDEEFEEFIVWKKDTISNEKGHIHNAFLGINYAIDDLKVCIRDIENSLKLIHDGEITVVVEEE